MKAKASVAHDFMKVSRDLEEALARGAFTACELRLISWLKARTYGVRIKEDEQWVALDATPITATFISTDTGLHKSRVKESITTLLSDNVLRAKNNGWLGINSRIGDWKRSRAGRDFDFDRKPMADIGLLTRDRLSPGQGVPCGGGQVVPRKGGQVVPRKGGQGVPCRGGQGVPGSPNARVEYVERERREGHPLLPNRKHDTPSARAELGAYELPPHEHPEYSKLSFKLQDRLLERWESRVAEERKKGACKKCQAMPRASEKWAYCRGCTSCSECGRKADGSITFRIVRGEIVCDACSKKARP